MKRYIPRVGGFDGGPWATMQEHPTGDFLDRDEVVSVLAQSGLDIDDVIDIDVLLSALDISEDEYLAAQEDT